MRLLNLQVSKLHGSIDKTVSFNEELSLLVGINGSGKTSVLSALDALLRPDLAYLAMTEYHRLTLTFEHDGMNLQLEAIQSPRDVNVYLRGMGVDMAPINIAIIRSPNRPVVGDDLDDMRQQYSRLTPDAKERPLWNAISALPKPVVITLDRSISAEDSENLYLDPATRFIPSGRRRPRSPLVKVKQVTTDKYREFLFRVAELNERLKGQMVMSALQDPQAPRRSAARISPREIETLEGRVLGYLSKVLPDTATSEEVKRYFHSAKIVARQANQKQGDEDVSWQVFSRQYSQIEDLANAFNEFETHSKAVFAELATYLQTINSFLADSRKLIFFEEATQELSFRFLNEANMPHGAATRSIDHLSSGERQVLILFTFLAFVAQEARVFIVDEPELSLHPKWQAEFLEAVIRLKPKKSQIVLATHSPDIVGRHKDACIVLLP